jgi:hypothetical protein
LAEGTATGKSLIYRPADCRSVYCTELDEHGPKEMSCLQVRRITLFGKKMSLETFKEASMGFALLLGLGWSAVFVVMLLDKVRGRPTTVFSSGGIYHRPKIRPLAWWQHAIRFPLYCVFVPAFAICLLILVPPTRIVALASKAKAR